MSGAVHDVLHTLALFLPKAVGFVVILVVGWVVARLLRAAVDKVLTRLGFDRAVDRGGIRSLLAPTRYDASDLVGRLVYYAVLLFTLQLAFGLWGPNPVSDLIRAVVAWLPRAFVAILIVVVAAAIANAVRDIVGSALARLPYGRLLAGTAAWTIIGLGVIAALNQIGVATAVTTPVLIAVLATVAGILIVGVGGGLVRPMQSRWESWLDRAAQESQAIAEHTRAYRAGQADARARLAKEKATAAAPVPAAAPTAAPAAAATAAPAPGSRGAEGTRAASAPTEVMPKVTEATGHGDSTLYGAPTPRRSNESEPTQVLPPIPDGQQPGGS